MHILFTAWRTYIMSNREQEKPGNEPITEVNLNYNTNHWCGHGIGLVKKREGWMQVYTTHFSVNCLDIIIQRCNDMVFSISTKWIFNPPTLKKSTCKSKAAWDNNFASIHYKEGTKLDHWISAAVQFLFPCFYSCCGECERFVAEMNRYLRSFVANVKYVISPVKTIINNYSKVLCFPNCISHRISNLDNNGWLPEKVYNY